MYLSGIVDNQPLVHGVVGHKGKVETYQGLSLAATAPMAEGPMLVDTGAQGSVLDLDSALELGLPETDAPTPIVGVAGTALAQQFTGLLHLPEWNITVATTFVSLPLRNQESQGLLAIIGMDVLSELVLTLDGPNRSIALSLPGDQ